MKLVRFLWGLPIALVLLIFWLQDSHFHGNDKGYENDVMHIESLYPGDVAMWEMLFSSEPAYEFEQEPLGIILPHHLAVGQHIARFYKGMAEWKRSDTVFVISPNHYEVGEANFQTCGNCVWESVVGDLELDMDYVKGLVDGGVAEIRDESFVKEHGIFAHTPFISRFFPEAKIVPILIKTGSSPEEISVLVDWLDINLRDEDLLIASIDFSHYKTLEEAEKDDALTHEAIVNFDTEALYELYRGNDKPTPIDSPTTANVILDLMGKRGRTNAVMIENTNTQQFYKAKLEETTSHQFYTFN